MRRKTATNLPVPEKQTFLKAMGEYARSPLFMSMLAAPIVGGLAGAVEQSITKARQSKQKAISYKQMLELHPHLRQRNQGEVNRIYNSLHNASPAMASDPMVAGAWVDNIIENKVPGMNSHQGLLNAMKDLAATQWQVTQAREKDLNKNRMREYFQSQVLQAGRDAEKVQRDGLNQAYKAQRKELEDLAAGNNEWLANQQEAIARERAGIEEARQHVMREAAEVDARRIGTKTSSREPDFKTLLRALRV